MYGIHDGSKIIARFTAPLSLTSNVPVFINDSVSLKRNVTKRSGQRWELVTNLEPLTFDANQLFAFMVLKGAHTPFNIVAPQNYGAVKALTATSLSVTAIGSVGDSQVAVSGNIGKIPMGTLIKFDNHSKVYMVASDLTDNGALQIFPNLRVGVNITPFKYRNDVLMRVLFEPDNVSGMSYTDGILMDMGSIKLVESL